MASIDGIRCMSWGGCNGRSWMEEWMQRALVRDGSFITNATQSASWRPRVTGCLVYADGTISESESRHLSEAPEAEGSKWWPCIILHDIVVEGYPS